MKERIAIFIPKLNVGGAERVSVKLSNEFVSRGYSVDLVLSRAEGSYLDLVSDEVNVVDLESPSFPFFSVMGSLLPLKRYLESNNPDVFISGLTHANVVALLSHRFSKVDSRIVVTEHNFLSKKVSSEEKFGIKMLPFLVKKTYRWADSIIPVSSGVCQDLSKITGINRSEMDVIYNPVYPNNIIEHTTEPVQDNWFTENECPVILSVGRLTKQKDFSTLIKGFKKVKNKRDVRLAIIGKGEKKDDIERMIERNSLNKSVKLLGYVENPFKYMAASNVFVLSSRWEGFGNVLVEAMACGTPVVSTDCPSGPSEILEEGEYGKLVPVGDSSALAQAIISTLDGDINSSKLKSRAKDFKVEKIADKYLEVILG